MKRTLIAAAVLAMCATVALASVASARAREETRVTIKAEGTDLFGYVKSDDPAKCSDGRKVKVFRVKRGEKEKVATDNAEQNGNRYQWSAGNLGLTGRFYARIKRIPGCTGDTSKTIRVQREET